MRVHVALWSLLMLAAAIPASGQPTFESAGERALGMGGAFVAVADDPSATHWNPAGLVTAGPVGMTFGWYRFQTRNPDAPPTVGAGRRDGRLTSLGTWPLGLSVGFFEMSTVAPSSADPALLEVQTLRTRQFGVTMLQTLVEGLVIGSNIHYLRGSVVTAPTEDLTNRDALDSTEDLEGDGTGAFDFDLGIMVDLRKVRVGLAVKNVTAPTFGDVSTARISLPRQSRLGVAYLPTAGLTLAMDVDLDTVDLGGDLRRAFALGGEGRLGQRVSVRAGLRLSTVGDRRLTGTAGMSFAIRSGFWIDGHYAYGQSDDEREFGVALRAGL